MTAATVHRLDAARTRRPVTPPLILADLLQAIDDAADYREGRFAFCPACRDAVDGICPDHDEDVRLAAAYRDMGCVFEAADRDFEAAFILAAALSGAKAGA